MVLSRAYAGHQHSCYLFAGKGAEPIPRSCDTTRRLGSVSVVLESSPLPAVSQFAYLRVRLRLGLESRKPNQMQPRLNRVQKKRSSMNITTLKPWNKTSRAAVCGLATVLGALSASAATTAWWRFEEGPANANVARNGQPDGTFYGAVADSSGNGYNLSAWSDGSYAGYVYRSAVGASTLPLNGAANNYSVKNTGGNPAMWSETGSGLQTWSPSAWTIEATFKLENGGYRTIVGRDSQGSATINGSLAALYLQAMPNNQLAIKFSDVSGYWHEAISANNAFTSFDYPTDNNGDLVPWYSMAAVSDGSTLSLYLRNLTSLSGWNLIAQSDLSTSGSPNTALSAGTGDGGDWDAGNFTVGRGLYGGGHGDRAWGFIDEVRLSDTALSVNDLVMVPEPTTATLIGLGLGAVILRRRQNRG